MCRYLLAQIIPGREQMMPFPANQSAVPRQQNSPPAFQWPRQRPINRPTCEPVSTHRSSSRKIATSVPLKSPVTPNPPRNIPESITHGEQYPREGVERADARPLAEIRAHIPIVLLSDTGRSPLFLRFLLLSQCGSCWREDGMRWENGTSALVM